MILCYFLQLTFIVLPEQLQVWTDDNQWAIPSGTYAISVGGQQPDQTVTVPSNVLKGSFSL